ncbi:MAG: hypothetical protein HUJ91_07385 [Bacteroidales bacterium]|nr:hypothetical protein [Bacteroidales bacterium]
MRMPDGSEKISALLVYGDNELNAGHDREAYHAYSEVMSRISWGTAVPEEREMLGRAYKGLCALCLSMDECTWEMAGQITGDYAAYLRGE